MQLAILRSAARAVVSAVSFSPGADLADSDVQDPARRTIVDTSTLLCVPKIQLPSNLCVYAVKISLRISLYLDVVNKMNLSPILQQVLKC